MLLTNASLEFDLLLLTMKLGLIKGILSLLLLFFFFFWLLLLVLSMSVSFKQLPTGNY